MPQPNVIGGISPNTGLFDFGGGVNFNPTANGGSMVSPNATAEIAPVQPNAVPSNNGGVMPRAYDFSTSPPLYPGPLFSNASPPQFSNQGTVTGITGAGGNGGTGYVPSWTPSGGVTGGSSNSPSLTGGTLPFYTGAQANNPTANLTSIFGNLGPYLMSMIQTGGYNPAVFQALVNQLQPQVNEGIATIGANTGASGTRFGSGYDLALGDYLSQVNLNESSMAAGLYENAVSNSLQALQIGAGPSAQYQSNKGGFTTALVSSLISSLAPSLIGLIPGLSGSGGSYGGSGTSYGSTGSSPNMNLSSLPSNTGATSYGMESLGLPGTVGTPNASDPFGGQLIPQTS